jgi:hypothetical protein
LVVAEIIRAQVAILTNDTLIARVLYADAIHTHARISVPITGLTSRVGGVLAPVVIGAVVSALLVVITRVLDADTIDTHAVFADLVNTIEVALTPVILRIIVALALMKVIDQAAIGGAFVLVVALLVRLAPFGPFSLFPTSHDPQGAECQQQKPNTH